KRCVLYVRSFLAKYRAKQPFFGSEFGLALRRNFPNQNIAWLHLCADTHDAVRAKVAQSFLAYIRNVARDFLRSQLRVACADLKLVDVNGSINVFLHDLLRNHDGVLEVVTVPRHERDEHIAPQSQLAVIGVRPVGDDLPAFHVLTLANDRFLIDASAGIGAHELPDLVNVNSSLRVRFELLFALGQMAVLADDDLVSRNRSDLAALDRQKN